MLTNLKIERSVAIVGLDAFSVPIVNADDNDIQITSIKGLGPVKADISSVPYTTRSGEYPTDKSIGKRNIVLTVRLNPKYNLGATITTLRQTMYRYFRPTDSVKLTFSSDELADVYISGTVESMEVDQFSEEPQLDISVLCFDPNFVSVVSGSFTGIAQPGDQTVDVVNNGTEDVGFVLELRATADVPSWTGDILIQGDAPNSPSMTLTNITLDSTYKYFISTVDGDRYVNQLNIGTGVYSSRLYKLTTADVWAKLHQLTNKVKVKATPGGPEFVGSYRHEYGAL